MNANDMNAFIESLKNVFKSYEIRDFAKKKVEIRDNLSTSYELSVSVGLYGDLIGNVSFCMSNQTAMNIASAMIGMTMEEVCEPVVSALRELANMVCGRATIKLAASGQKIDLTPPVLVNGTNLKVYYSPIKTLSVLLDSQCGVIEINLGIEN